MSPRRWGQEGGTRDKRNLLYELFVILFWKESLPVVFTYISLTSYKGTELRLGAFTASVRELGKGWELPIKSCRFRSKCKLHCYTCIFPKTL